MSNLVSYMNIHDEQNRGGQHSTARHQSQALKHRIAETKGAENVHRAVVVADIMCNRSSPSLGSTFREGAIERVSGENMQSLISSANRQLEALLE